MIPVTILAITGKAVLVETGDYRLVLRRLYTTWKNTNITDRREVSIFSNAFDKAVFGKMYLPLAYVRKICEAQERDVAPGTTFEYNP